MVPKTFDEFDAKWADRPEWAQLCALLDNPTRGFPRELIDVVTDLMAAVYLEYAANPSLFWDEEEAEASP